MYAVARNATPHRIILPCNLSDLQSNPIIRKRILHLAENTCVCLFFCWTGMLTSEYLESPRLLARHYLDVIMARSFSQITEKAFEKIRWRKPLGRGLNWSTPLTDEWLRSTPSSFARCLPLNAKTCPIRVYRSAPKSVLHAQETNTYRVELLKGGVDR
jgi:hypothetical protein